MWAPGPFWTDAENLCTTVSFRIRIRPHGIVIGGGGGEVEVRYIQGRVTVELQLTPSSVQDGQEFADSVLIHGYGIRNVPVCCSSSRSQGA